MLDIGKSVKKAGSRIWLLICSLFFYACWNLKYLIILIISIVTTYLCGIFLEKEEAEGGSGKIKNDWHKDIGNRTLEIKDDHKTKVGRGIEVVVYDKLSEEVVDAVCFDADNGWAITRNED